MSCNKLLTTIMKTLLLLAVLGFVLSVGFTLPFSEDEAQNDELKDIAGDFETENPNRYDGGTKEVFCQKHLRCSCFTRIFLVIM